MEGIVLRAATFHVRIVKVLSWRGGGVGEAGLDFLRSGGEIGMWVDIGEVMMGDDAVTHNRTATEWCDSGPDWSLRRQD